MRRYIVLQRRPNVAHDMCCRETDETSVHYCRGWKLPGAATCGRSLIQVKARAHCSEGHLIVSVSCLQSAVHLANSRLSANLCYRACMLYLMMSSMRGVARLDCLDIISKCSSAAQFIRTSHLGSLHGFVCSPSPSLC